MDNDLHQQLPTEIWLHIFSFIESAQDLSRLAIICKLWNQLSKEEELWKTHCLKRYKMCRLQKYGNSWRNYYISRHRTFPAQTVNRILVQSLDGGYYTINPDGSNQKPLITVQNTTKVKQFQQATWSPHADQIAVARMDLTAKHYSLVTVDSMSGEILTETLTKFPAFYIYWHPSGSCLTFLSNYRQGMAYQVALQYIDLDTDPSNSQVLDCGRPYFYCWLPDTSLDLLSHNTFTKMFLVHAASAKLQKLQVAPPHEFAAFSCPIVCKRRRTNPPTLTSSLSASSDILSSSTSSVISNDNNAPLEREDDTVTEFIYAIEDSSKRKRGSRSISSEISLIASVPRSVPKESELNKMNVKQIKELCTKLGIDTSECIEKSDIITALLKYLQEEVVVEQKVVFSVFTEIDYFSFLCTKDGSKVAYSVRHMLELFDRDKQASLQEQYRPAKLGEQVLGYFWSPNSRYLLFLCFQEEDSREFTWWIHDTKTPETYALCSFVGTQELVNNYLPFFAQYALSMTFFSPDSESFVFCDEFTNGVYVCSVKRGSQPVKIGDGVFATWAPV